MALRTSRHSFTALRHLFLAVSSVSAAGAAASLGACGGSVGDDPLTADAGSGGDGGEGSDGAPAGDGSVKDTGVDASGFDLDVCEGGSYLPLAKVTPAVAAGYVELRTELDASFGTDGAPATIQVVAQNGAACAGATDAAACNKKLADLRSSTGWVIPGIGRQVPTHRYLVFTRGDAVGAVTSLDDLKTFLLDIENVKDAALLLSERGHSFVCGTKNARKTAAGFELITKTGDTCGPGTGIDQHVVSVTAQGEITITRTVRIEDGDPNCAVGRRPEGFTPTASAEPDAVGRYFAEVAELEHASVHAFRRLAGELAAHGAPAELVHSARRSVRDEIRHTAATTSLAHRFGAEPATPNVPALPLRELFAIALENAVEGCVRETFGAVQATFQASHAADARIARTMRGIAADETRHAALAWEVAAWIEPLLSQDQRSAIETARREAVTKLARDLAVDPDARVTHLAGAPTAGDCARLLRAIDAQLWAA
jgi:hypothetical protein